MVLLATLLEEIVDDGDLIPVIAIVGGLTLGAIGIIFTTMKSVLVARAREQTKRELAAYVAEGTLDPDKAVAMLSAGRAACGSGDACC